MNCYDKMNLYEIISNSMGLDLKPAYNVMNVVEMGLNSLNAVTSFSIQ